MNVLLCPSSFDNWHERTYGKLVMGSPFLEAMADWEGSWSVVTDLWLVLDCTVLDAILTHNPINMATQNTCTWISGHLKNQLFLPQNGDFFCSCIRLVSLYYKRKMGQWLVMSSVTINEPPHDKNNKLTVHSAKTQISLGIRPVWSESSLCTQLVAKDLSFLHADSEDSDQTRQMPRLIRVFSGRTCHFVGFLMRQLKYQFCTTCL